MQSKQMVKKYFCIQEFKIVIMIIQTKLKSSGGICIKWNTLSQSVESKESVARCTS